MTARDEPERCEEDRQSTSERISVVRMQVGHMQVAHVRKAHMRVARLRFVTYNRFTRADTRAPLHHQEVPPRVAARSLPPPTELALEQHCNEAVAEVHESVLDRSNIPYNHPPGVPR